MFIETNRNSLGKLTNSKNYAKLCNLDKKIKFDKIAGTTVANEVVFQVALNEMIFYVCTSVRNFSNLFRVQLFLISKTKAMKPWVKETLKKPLNFTPR